MSIEPRYNDQDDDGLEETKASGTNLNEPDSQEDENEDNQEPEEMTLEDFKLTAQHCALALKKGKEPIYQLENIVKAIRDAIRTDRMGQDEEFNFYMMETYGLKLMQPIARERSSDDEVSISRLCFQHFARIVRFWKLVSCALCIHWLTKNNSLSICCSTWKLFQAYTIHGQSSSSTKQRRAASATICSVL